MPTIVHFEIPADSIERARGFYSELFGWKIEKYETTEEQPATGQDPMEYWLISTTNEKGEKAVEGGMMKRQHPQQTFLNYIDVPSVEDYVSRVEQLGGSLVVPKTPVPTMGYFAVCMDTENNAFGIWETDENAQ
jgi:predicted enzyme related to lactoylglutathione lyase